MTGSKEAPWLVGRKRKKKTIRKSLYCGFHRRKQAKKCKRFITG
jgi:hypothetical protein